MSNIFILTLQCVDRKGLVADVSGFITAHDANIIDAQQYHDPENGQFFMRIEFSTDEGVATRELQKDFEGLAQDNDMDWRLSHKSYRPKVLIMVSKFDHCLGDLLSRWRRQELDMEVIGIGSNHPKESLKTAYIGDIPHFHLPITKHTKPEQEAAIKKIVEDHDVDLVVLARYMQILSDDLVSYLKGRCINIHHSFLPGFKGAKPYHQAHKRGVKMIGATAHYVTTDLDEGPIIHQDVEAVSHIDTPADMVRKGRDIERRVLATAVRHHLQGRVFPNGERTVVFKA